MVLIQAEWFINYYRTSNISSDGNRPDYTIDPDYFMPAFYLENKNFSQGDSAYYFGAYFVQYKGADVIDQHKAALCTTIVNETQIYLAEGFYEDNWFCPDVRKEDLKLGGPQHNSYNFALVIATCEDSKTETGRDNCSRSEESKNLMDTTKLYFRVVAQVPDGNIYINSTARIGFQN